MTTKNIQDVVAEKFYWQPIDTIPKDGTHVLVTNMTIATCPCTVAHWFEYIGDSSKSGLFLSWNAKDEDSDYQMDSVTHWMPIPDRTTLTQLVKEVEAGGYKSGIEQTIAQFLRMNLENPKAPVNVDEVKRRALSERV